MYLFPDRSTEALVETIAAEPKVCRYVDMPFQHAARELLRGMNRPGDGEEYLRLLQKLRTVSPDIVVRSTNRGGLVTYHGPGQPVGYLIARLATFAGNAPALVRGIEQAIIRALGDFAIQAFQYPQHRGVFTEQGKIAAVGLGVRRGITMHGFALNRAPNLGHFALINPCGLAELGVTSMERILGSPPNPRAVNEALAFHLGTVFGQEISWQTEPHPVRVRIL